MILKAAAGGGGRGMRIVRSDDRARERSSRPRASEAEEAFGDGSIYLEKYLDEPRHIEFQVFGDQHGNVIHLGERECSIQRRHQKLIEEAPSPALTPELRERDGRGRGARSAATVGYENAGTIEFLLDRDGSFYFMEMNTRIQVEHPVTEMVTGIDLVKQQIAVAAGEPLGIPNGLQAARPRHRVPDQRRGPATPSRPRPGKLTTFHLPGGPGVRVDTHGYEDYVVPPHYDSLVAKLIVHGRDREEAIARMLRALDFFVVEGIQTSIPLHQRILRDPEFRAGRLSTRFMEALPRSATREVGERRRESRAGAPARARLRHRRRRRARARERAARRRGREMAAAGVESIQLRAKRLADGELCAARRGAAAALSRVAARRSGSTTASTSPALLPFAGVHLGPARPAAGRGAPAARRSGWRSALSTHDAAQLAAAGADPAVDCGRGRAGLPDREQGATRTRSVGLELAAPGARR